LKIDRAEGETDGIGDGGLGDIHETLQTKGLLGIGEVELDLKA